MMVHSGSTLLPDDERAAAEQVLLMPAAEMSDARLRRELIETHVLELAVRERGLPVQRAYLEVRTAELDSEYLRRYPHAADRWPWRSATTSAR
jgi:hypothetical protein